MHEFLCLLSLKVDKHVAIFPIAQEARDHRPAAIQFFRSIANVEIIAVQVHFYVTRIFLPPVLVPLAHQIQSYCL